MDAQGEIRQKQKAEYRILHKEKMAAQTKAWAKANPDKMCDYTKKYRDDNRERLAIRRRELYQLNKEKVSAQKKAFYHRNAEAQRQRSRDYKAANIEVVREKNKLSKRATKEKDSPRRRAHSKANRAELSAKYKEWDSKNRSLIASYAAERRAIVAGATIGNVDVIIAWESRWRNSESVRCYWCQNNFPGADCHSDHVVAIKNGGTHSIDNLCVACQSCNNQKSARSLSTWNNLLTAPTLL